MTKSPKTHTPDNLPVVTLTISTEANRLMVHFAIHPRWLFAGLTLAGMWLSSTPVKEGKIF